MTGPNPSGDYSMAYYTGFMRRFLDVMEIDRCVLAGKSAGGLVAWHFAVAEPGRIERLVLLASSGYPKTIPPALAFRIAMSPFGSIILHLLSKSSVANSVRRTYGDPSKVTQEVIDRTYEVMLRAGNRDALGPAIRQARSDDNAALIARIAAPTLILWGTLDTVVPPSDADRFKADIRGSELVLFAGVGHLPQEEAPDETVAAFREFLGA